MGLLDWLFGNGSRRATEDSKRLLPQESSTPPSPPVGDAGSLSGKVVALKGTGDFALHVVGESYCQAELEALAGGRSEDGCWIELNAVLAPDLGNTHDPNAIMVLIEGQRVGFLDRPTAKLWQMALFAEGVKDAVCPCVITGGWDRGRGDRGNFGVRLDVEYPLTVIATS